MMRPSYNQGYENPGYPHSMPNYWGGYPQEMPYYPQPMQPYPFQMAGDHVMQQLNGQNLYQPQSFQEQHYDNWNDSRTTDAAVLSTTIFFTASICPTI